MLDLYEPDYSFRAPPRPLTGQSWAEEGNERELIIGTDGRDCFRMSKLAPCRQYTKTPGTGYNEGYENGLKWEAHDRPGGPYVATELYSRNPEWIAYARLTKAVHDQWLLGFADGVGDSYLYNALLCTVGTAARIGSFPILSGHHWFTEQLIMTNDELKPIYDWLEVNTTDRWVVSLNPTGYNFHFAGEEDATLMHLRFL